MKKFILSLLISFCTLFVIRLCFWGYIVCYVIKWYRPDEWFQISLATFLLLILALIIKRIRHKLYALIGIALGMLIVFSIDAYSDYTEKYIFDEYNRMGNCLIKQDGRKAYLLDKKQNVIIESVKFERFPTFFTFIDKENLHDSYGYIHTEYDETDDGLRYTINQLYLYDESYKLYATYEIETAYDDRYIEHNKSLYGDDWNMEEDDCNEIQSLVDIIEYYIGKIKGKYNVGSRQNLVLLGIKWNMKENDNENIKNENINHKERIDDNVQEHSGMDIYNSTGDFNNYNSTGGNYDNVNQDVETTHQKKWRNVTRIVDCPQCYTGSCTTCNGKGWYDSPYGTGSIKCPNCDPNNIGKCSNCHGSGKIEKIEQVWE